jgi:hypothetical protein
MIARLERAPERGRILVLLRILVAVAAVWLIWRAHRLPVYGTGHILFRDDTAVLSERAWFESNAQWLRHLLFFNQTRFTAVGDYVLVRPLLFATTWAADVLFRSNRDLHYWLSMVISAFGLLTLIRVGKRSGLPLIISVPIASSLFLMHSDHALLTWSHITPYLFALALPIWGMMRITSTPEDRLDWGAIALFVIATCFHEAAALGLIVTGVVAFLTTRRERKWFAFHFLFAAALYVLLYAAVMFSYRPPAVVDATTDVAVAEKLTRISESTVFFFRDLMLGLPIAALAGNRVLYTFAIVVFWLAVCTAIAWCARHFRGASSWADRWLLWSIVIHFAAFFGGYAITRFGTRPVQSWYLQMALYYLLAATLVVFGVMYRGTPRSFFWKTLVVAVTATLWVANYAASSELADISENKWTRYSPQRDVTRAVLQYLEQTHTCFAGSTSTSPMMSDALSILLYYESCTAHPEREAAYFDMGPSGGAAYAVSWAPASAHRATSLTASGNCVNSEAMTFAEYDLSLATRDTVPIRYPMTFFVAYADGLRTRVDFRDNTYFVNTSDARGHLLRISDSMHLRLRRSARGIAMFSDVQLLTLLPPTSTPIRLTLCKPQWIEARASFVR